MLNVISTTPPSLKSSCENLRIFSSSPSLRTARFTSLEYLFYGEAIRAYVLHHNKQYISKSVGNANKYSMYQKPLTERKGDFKGKDSP